MADWPAKRAAAFNLQFPIYDADGDLVTAAATLDTEVSKDGGTFADATNEAAEIATSSGCYRIVLTATEMTADEVMTITKTGTAGAKTAVNMMYTATRQLIDLAFPNVSGRGMDVDAAGGVEVGTFQAGAITAAAFAAGSIDAAAIANGAIDAATFAAGAIDAAALAANAGEKILQTVSGTADAGGSTTTIVDAERTEADTDYWKGSFVLITSGTAIGQIRRITAFNATTDTLTVSPAFTQSIGAGVTYIILRSAAAEILVDAIKANAIDATAIATGAIDAATFAAGAIDNAAFNVTETLTANPAAGGIAASSFAAGAIDAAAIATGAIDADAIATAAIDADAIAAAAITSAKFAAGAIDANAIASDAAKDIRAVASGTADSGTTTTMVDAARTEADTDYWKGDLIVFTSGTISGQTRLITAFDPVTDTITFTPATTQAVSTQTYEILPAGRSDVALWLGAAVNALQAGRVDAFVGAMAAAVITSGAFAAGAIDAAAIATDAIGAAELAADAVNEIADGIMTRASSNWEATAPVKSLGAAVMKAVHRIRDNAGTLEIYRSNGVTIHASQTITTDAANNPIDELTGAV